MRTFRYGFARAVGARGVGMWTATSINYSDPAMVRTFWDDLKVF